MRINKVTAINSQTKQREIYVFGDAAVGKPVLQCENLCSYLEFCFQNKESLPVYVEVEYSLNEEEFVFSKLQSRDGVTRVVLKRKENDLLKTVARDEEAAKRVQDDLQLSFSSLPVCVSSKTLDAFGGDLSEIAQLKAYLDAEKQISDVLADARARKEDAARKLRECAPKAADNVTAEQLIRAQSEEDEATEQLDAAVKKLNVLRFADNQSGYLRDTEQKLKIAQNRYDRLIAFSGQAEEARKKTEQDDRYSRCADSQRMLELAERRDEYDTRRCELVSELEWKEQELADVVAQYEQRRLQYTVLQEKRSRMATVKSELEYISALRDQNGQLGQLLSQLFEKQRRYDSERKTCLECIAGLETSLNEIRVGLDALQVPSHTSADLMEAVRADTRMDEVTSQLDKLQNEINVKENQIAEKENSLSVQKKRFRSVADLDVAVSPIKAKDTILQVLDAKYSKLEAINASLTEKQRNLERASDDYKYKISQLEDSRAKLIAGRDKALLRKQEEFKREVLLNSQKVPSNDVTGVFAATTGFQDIEIQTLEQEIADRNADRDLLAQRAAQLDGAIKEIKRHKEINAAEMETLRREKENINNRYNEIVSQNNSEAVFNYLKALHNDNSTKYLLDMQQDAVRLEAEVSEMRRYSNALKQKVSDLKQRLNSLQEKRPADVSDGSIDETVLSNDVMRDRLAETGEKLVVICDRHLAEQARLNELDSKLQSISSAVTEAARTIKVNEAQIKKSAEKAQKLVGEEDPEQAVQNFNYDLSDIESELQMLAESKNVLSQEVFSKRLELEKTQWLCSEAIRESEALSAKQSEDGFASDTEKNEFERDCGSIDALRAKVRKYDVLLIRIAEKIRNYKTILNGIPEDVSDEALSEQQRLVDELSLRQRNAEEKRRELTEKYAASEAAKVSVAAAAAQVGTLSGLQQTLKYLDMASLMFADKISAFLNVAADKASLLAGRRLKLWEKDGKLRVSDENGVFDFGELPLSVKAAAYVGVMLSANTPDEKCFVFDSGVFPENDGKVAELLAQTDGVRIVVDARFASLSESASTD